MSYSIKLALTLIGSFIVFYLIPGFRFVFVFLSEIVIPCLAAIMIIYWLAWLINKNKDLSKAQGYLKPLVSSAKIFGIFAVIIIAILVLDYLKPLHF